MRTIVRRAPFWFAALGAAVSASALAAPAAAEPSLHLGPAARARLHARVAPHAPLVIDHEARARTVVGLHSSFAATRAALQATATDRFGDGESIVHLEQTHGGLPVIGRGAAVRLTSGGEEILTTLDLEEDLPSTVPSLPAAAAASIAARFAPVAAAVTHDDAHLVVWPLVGGGSRLAYVVLPSVPTGIASAPRIVVDAHTGKVIEARDLVRFAKANMYRTNPTKSPTLEPLELALTPGATLTNEFVASYNCIDRKTVRALNISGFKANVHVCDIDQLATADANGDFLAYEPSDTPGAMTSRSDPFSEVSMYYHAARAYDFFRTLQGDPAAQVVDDKPLRVVANLQIPAGISSGNIAAAANPDTPLETFSNAFFSPAAGGLGAIFQQLYGLKGGGLWFGQGPQRDYAYDGDVVYHELGHAVVDHSLKLGAWHVDARGAIDAPGAMNEGLADYFSSAITGDPDIGEYASKDISQNAGVLRTLANQDACPTSVIGEVHFDSTLFSGALWSARTALPEANRAAFDAALYKAMRTNPGRGDLGFDDLAKLFLATLATDLPAGATALEAAMKARGVLPSCDRIVEPKNGSVKAIEPIVGGFAAPGLQSIPLGVLAPGILQVHGKVAPTDAKLVVGVTTRASSGAPANPLGGNATPFAPVALVKFGKPITWTVSRGDSTHDADKAVPMTAGTRRTATFEVPAGTTDVYVQIANEGDSDGAYDNVTLDLAPAAAEPATTEEPPAEGAPVTRTESTTGCACTTTGAAGDTTSRLPFAGLVAALGLAAGVVRRRRR